MMSLKLKSNKLPLSTNNQNIIMLGGDDDDSSVFTGYWCDSL